MLEVDYPSLDRVDVCGMDRSRIHHQVQLGDHVEPPGKAWPAPEHVMPLDLPPGAQRTLLIRV